MSICFICNEDIAQMHTLGMWDHSVNCKNCGRYIITSQSADWLNNENKIKLSTLLRERFLKGLNPIAIFKDTPNRGQINPHISWPIITIDELINNFPKNVSERIDRTLANLALSTNFPGNPVEIKDGEYSNFFRQTDNSEEIFFLMNQLAVDGLVAGNIGILIPFTFLSHSTAGNSYNTTGNMLQLR
jgi:hypothetical protein